MVLLDKLPKNQIRFIFSILFQAVFGLGKVIIIILIIIILYSYETIYTVML